jgi:hypothetical protein
MKKTILAIGIGMGIGAGAMFLGARVGNADEFHEGCRIKGIEQGLSAAITEIKQSPAFGHAGGHYKRSIEDIEKTKHQLREGCHAWMKEKK